MSTEDSHSPSSEKGESTHSPSEETEKEKVEDADASRSSKSESPEDAKDSSNDDSTEPSSSTKDQSTDQPVVATTNPTQGDWQAIWSPQHNAYYFYNSRTNETTWTNPLAVSEASSSSATLDGQNGSSMSSYEYSLQAAAAAQGIDPSLAYLDPSLAAGPSTPAAFTYQAKFNARTGTFTRPDGRDPNHVSEYERMKRMSQFYFDVSQWEQEVAQRNEEDETNPKKRKKPTKKDLEMFKERKKQKKIAKTAWLRT